MGWFLYIVNSRNFLFPVPTRGSKRLSNSSYRPGILLFWIVKSCVYDSLKKHVSWHNALWYMHAHMLTHTHMHTHTHTFPELTHKTTFAYLLLFMAAEILKKFGFGFILGRWWSNEWRGLVILRFGSMGLKLPAFVLYLKIAFFEAHLVS